MPAFKVPNMRPKRRADGAVAWHWEVPSKDRRRGCPLQNEALGTDLARAVARAQELNRLLKSDRDGGEGPGRPPHGSVAWLFDQVEKHPKFTTKSPKTQKGYSAGFALITAYVLPKSGTPFGRVPAQSVKERHVDHLYQALQWTVDIDPDTGAETPRRRLATANAAMRAARRAWSIGNRAGWVQGNPFRRMELRTTGGDTRPAEAAEVAAFIAQADAMGRPSMGTAALLAFELCQRENDVIETLAWSHYRPGREIRIRQHKTGTLVWIDLVDDEGPLFPELEARLADTPRRGPLIVMRDQPVRRRPDPGGDAAETFVPYKADHFRHVFRDIADAAGLAKDFTFMSLRHGGLTELGDAKATDQEMQGMGGHKTRQMLSVYSTVTRRQARNAARKRRVLRQERTST